VPVAVNQDGRAQALAVLVAQLLEMNMWVRVIVTAAALAAHAVAGRLLPALVGGLSASVATRQVDDSVLSYGLANWLANGGVESVAWWALVAFLVLVWIGPALRWVKPDGRNTSASWLVLILVALSLGGCGWKPYDTPEYIEIKPNETAFLVPLEGQSNAGQAKFMSIEFLDAAKVATKRVQIPHRWSQTGYFTSDGRWLPTMRVVTVDRTPVNREWVQAHERGTSLSDQAIYVESRESIDFRTGVSASAVITEEDAAMFLYWFNGKTLAQVMDENVRGAVQQVLWREFGSRSLDECRNDKARIMQIALSEISQSFKAKGVTITSLGGAEGLTYADPKIQEAINATFKAQNDRLTALAEREAQATRNETTIAKARAEREAAEEFAKALPAFQAQRGLDIARTYAEAFMEFARKPNSSLPQYLVVSGENGGLNALFQMPAPPATRQ
jgi:hypothetical protein